jgi:peptidoglycan/xylan/chitin deacetylase (PgdA/CDA1 family)
MRSRFGRALERLLVHSGVIRIVARRRGSSLIIAYHNIVPHGARPPGERSLHLEQRIFAQQLDVLHQIARVVPLQRIGKLPVDGDRAPRVAITFDDAYRGAMTAGVDELVKRGLPATVFAAPAMLGDQVLWWDRLATLHGGVPPVSVREDALESSRGDSETILRKFDSPVQKPATVPDHARTVTEEELASVAALDGLTVGSHSWSHRNLARLGPADLAQELQRSKRWLEDRYSSFIPWLAYPYGLTSPVVERAAEQAGYVAALRIEGGWLARGNNSRYRLPRLNIPAGLSANGFRLRLAGLRCR